MPSKKAKSDQTEEEALKPLGHYVKDRLELTRQLFSCLKKKQIRSRLPPNLQNKSIARIQQICLDEVLGISSKRLLSIINNTKCPLNTDSDSDIETPISLSDISSSENSDEEQQQPKAAVPEKAPPKKAPEKVQPPKKTTEKVTQKKAAEKTDKAKKPETEKEMTMLELLELQARARAIRSQLALEPVTKIELDDSDEEGRDQRETTELENSEKISNGNDREKQQTRSSPPRKSQAPASKAIEESSTTTIILPAVSPTKKAPPVKLKRNYKGSQVNNATEPVNVENIKVEEEKPAEVRCESPDVIPVEQNITTVSLLDSDEEEKEPPAKKSTPSPEISNENVESATQNSPKSQKEKSPERVEPESEDDGDIVNLMSDTEIDVNDDERNDSADPEPEIRKSPVETQEKIESPKEPEVVAEKNQNVSDYDDDVIEILHSEDDFLDDSDKQAESSQNTETESETWKERWLKSSIGANVKSVMETTKLASKVRSKIVKNKKSNSELMKKNEERKKEKEKEHIERITNAEEGSIEHFNTLKE